MPSQKLSVIQEIDLVSRSIGKAESASAYIRVHFPKSLPVPAGNYAEMLFADEDYNYVYFPYLNITCKFTNGTFKKKFHTMLPTYHSIWEEVLTMP